MMRTISHLNRVSKFAFSSQVSAQMTDWEYTTKIQQSLQQNDINQALKYLINSYLDGQVLDMHIFRNYYLKADKLKVASSYSEVAYQLYRQHFKPHSLVLDWMNSLARSKNNNIINMLQQDFKVLGVEMPQTHKIQLQQPIQLKEPSQKVLPTVSNQSAPSPAQKNNQEVKKDSDIPPRASKLGQSESIEKLKHQYSIEDIGKIPALLQMAGGSKGIIAALLELKPSISFHNVHVNLGDPDRFEQQYEEEENLANQENQEGNQDEADDAYYMDDVVDRVIKIERIDISFNRSDNHSVDKTDKEN